MEIARDDRQPLGADLLLIPRWHERQVVVAQRIRRFRFVLAMQCFMQVDVKLDIVPRADQHAEDQQPVHLEQQLDFQVVLLYQARPHVQRDVLLAVFLEPQGTLLDAREWAKSHFTWRYACFLARLLRRAGLCCRRLFFFSCYRALLLCQSVYAMLLSLSLYINHRSHTSASVSASRRLPSFLLIASSLTFR